MNNKLIDPETGLFCRSGEKVGGGFFIFRRGVYGNRIKPGTMPFEHPDYISAKLELVRLQTLNPEYKYHIFGQVE